MKNFKVLVIMSIVFSFSSCSVEEKDLDGDIAQKYLGSWSYFDERLGKDASAVEIERVGDKLNEIYIRNFHNFGLGSKTKFKLSNHDLLIISIKLEGLAIKGKGSSNYSFDKIEVNYEIDGDSFRAEMTKLD